MAMPKADEEFCVRMAGLSNAIATRINESSAQSKALKASQLLIRRMTNSCNSIMLLAACSRHDCRVDAGTLLRTIYDASLQCLYMLHDPNLQEERASLYLDFQWVERMKFIEVVDRNDSDLAARIRRSPRREKAEGPIRAEFERVKQRFMDKKGKLRRNWYVGTLRDLAGEVGCEEEYELFQRELSALTHTSPFAVDSVQPGPDPSRVVTHAWLLNLRPLRAIAGIAGVQLTPDEDEVLTDSLRSLVSMG